MSILFFLISHPVALYRYLFADSRYRYYLKQLLKYKVRNANSLAFAIIDKNGPSMIERSYRGKSVFFKNEPGAVYYMTEGIRKLEGVVEHIHLPEDALIIDGGGNVGLFSCFLLQKNPSAKAIVIEPSKELLPIIQKNLYPYLDRVTIIPKALSDKNGPLIFYINSEAQQTNSTNIEAVEFFNKDSSQIIERTVEAVTLETIFQEYNIEKLSLLKLDIQGGEFSVLSNSLELLKDVDQLAIEVSFIDDDSIKLCSLCSAHFLRSKVIGEVKMGADILF